MIILVNETHFYEYLRDFVCDTKNLEGKAELEDGEDIMAEILLSLCNEGSGVIQKYVEAEVSLEQFINQHEPAWKKVMEVLEDVLAQGNALSQTQELLYHHANRFLELCDKEREDQKHLVDGLEEESRESTGI